ncbi:MAG TPA: cytochrome C oxidase subunit IV family protein [Planctomycetota bacterium]|nr:cytochrome C oxidase subunit IV family protein [Planctomycetota bacterium]
MVRTRTYFLVYLGLVALSALTFGLSFAPIGAIEIPAALAIAIAKALLVLLFFMHLVEEKRPYWIFMLTGALLLAILVAIMALDVVTREPKLRQEVRVDSRP